MRRRYFIRLIGFEGHYVEAETASKARYKDFRAYHEAGYGSGGFRDYLGRIEVFHHHGPAAAEVGRAALKPVGQGAGE